MRVALVLPEIMRGWIVEKMATKLNEALCSLGIEADVTLAASPTADVNHFMIYHHVQAAPKASLNTMAVTHVDDDLKVDMVKRCLRKGVRAAICMSAMTVEQLAGLGVERASLTYALPAHDNVLRPRRIVMGITSNNYSDGRKRDWLLTNLARDMRLDAFTFEIFGRGWDEVAAALAGAGAEVRVTLPTADDQADYSVIQRAVPLFDYYFYPGLDEGSMGTLDALAAGVKTIVTRQGFHLDIPAAITHGFWDYEELREIFESLRDERDNRSQAAAQLSWARYAQRHLDIWMSLRDRNLLPEPDRVSAFDERASLNRNLAGGDRAYPMLSYKALMSDPYRRTMAYGFWIPRTYGLLQAARRAMGRVKRAVVAAAS